MDRRKHLRWLGSLLAASALPWAPPSTARDQLLIRVDLPGPHALPFLPLELIRPLGLERAANAQLHLRYFTSGILALEDMLAGNANFAAHSFSVLPGMHKKGKPAVAIASIAGTEATLAMLVRNDLADKIKHVSDLRFHSIGVSSGSVNSKTYQQMLAEQMLSEYGLGSKEIRWVPMGQNWESIKSVLESRSADAVFCEEPFATRAVEKGLARFLFHTRETTARKTPADGHPLRAVISIRAGNSTHLDDEARTLVSMLQQSLAWMSTAKPQAIVNKLGISDAKERKELTRVLERHSDIFCQDTSFSSAALKATAVFLSTAGTIDNAATLAEVINDRWVGRRP